MPKRTYKAIKMGDVKMEVVNRVNTIIATYAAQDYRLTLRQIYYQMVAHDWFPDSHKWTLVGSKWQRDPNGTKNAQPNYDWLGDIVGDARMSGLIDWNALEDRTRELTAVAHWETPADIVAACSRSFRLDKWIGQTYRIECWVEKDALEGIVERSAHSRDCAAFSCRGYGSLTSLWEASQRLMKYIKNKQRPVILHLGDHDPSGIDMTRDIRDRLNDFIETDWLNDKMAKQDGIKSAKRSEIHADITAFIGDEPREDDDSSFFYPVIVRRIALTRAQVDRYNPPPNPAKTADARYKKYVEEHGEESWELDALEPTVLDTLITSTIDEYLEGRAYNQQIEAEKKHCELLTRASVHWNSGLSDYIGALKKEKKDGKNKTK